MASISSRILRAPMSEQMAEPAAPAMIRAAAIGAASRTVARTAVAPANDWAPSWPVRFPTWSEMTAPKGIETRIVGIRVTLVMNQACSTNSRNWEHVSMGFASCLVIVPVTLFMARRLRVLEMGDDLAAGLGLHPGKLRFVALATAALAAGLAAALVGPIAFIALVAPAIARRLTRNPGITVAASVLMGSALTVLADLAARELLKSAQLPVGLYTSLIGGPYLIYLIVRSKGQFQ